MCAYLKSLIPQPRIHIQHTNSWRKSVFCRKTERGKTVIYEERIHRSMLCYIINMPFIYLYYPYVVVAINIHLLTYLLFIFSYLKRRDPTPLLPLPSLLFTTSSCTVPPLPPLLHFYLECSVANVPLLLFPFVSICSVL